MDKEKLKKIKVIYYPYKVVKKISGNLRYFHSLFYISKNRKRVRNKINNEEVLNVIFLVQYIPGWNKLEPIYSKMRNDKRFNPLIVCVPLNIQNHKLVDNSGNDTYEYFVGHGYEAINSLTGDGIWYDLKQLDPDYLFHSRPYNHFMPDCYTSGKIVKYALICNVMYGASMTTSGQDVWLNKDYFRNAYLYFAFDCCEKNYYENKFRFGVKSGLQKCLPYGSTGLEQILKSECGEQNLRFKKTVLWTPRWSTDLCIGGSNFFNYKDALIHLAKENRDILFVFRPHPLMFDNFIKTGEMSREEVAQFKGYCAGEKNIVLDESKEYADKFWNSDFLITDASGIVPEYFVTRKPILYCHTYADFTYAQYAMDMIGACYEVKDEEDINSYFNEIVNDNDYKLRDREECLAKYFADVKNNSSNILNALGREGLL